MEAIRNSALIVMMSRGVVLKGQVVREDGFAVEKALITIKGESGRTSSLTLKTDHEGRFDFIAGKNEGLHITVQKDGFARLSKRLRAKEGMEPLKLVSETAAGR